MKAIIFDCFGVLTTDYWREFVAGLAPGDRQAAGDLNKAYDAGFISTSAFTDHIEELTGLRPDLVEHTREPAVKNYDLLDYIAELKRHYKIGLLSNIATNWITDEFLTAAEQDLFDAMVFSHTVHLAKPDHRIFELMAAKLDVEPTACIMVDDLEVNCTGAREIGMGAVVYTDYPHARSDIERLLS